jgi:hypothetical protein
MLVVWPITSAIIGRLRGSASILTAGGFLVAGSSLASRSS